MTFNFSTIIWFILIFGFFGGVASFLAFCIYGPDGDFRDKFYASVGVAFLFSILNGVIGVAGAFAIQILLLGMRFYEKTATPSPSDFVFLAAICLVGGFAARSFLNQVTQMFARQISQQVEEAKQVAERAGDLSEEQARQFVLLASTHDNSPLPTLEYVVKASDFALKKDPKDPTFLIAKGAALKRLGRIQDAIDVLTPYITENASASRADKYISTAFYNRACYRALLDKPAEALADLKRSLELSENVSADKACAANDEDFAKLRGNPDFTQLVS